MEILVASLRPAASSSTLQAVDVSCKSAEMGYFVPVVTPQIPLRADYAFISFYGFADLRFSLLFCLSLSPSLLVISSPILFVRHIIRFVSMRPFEWYVRLDETFSIYFSIPFLLHFSSSPSDFRYLSSFFSPLRRL